MPFHYIEGLKFYSFSTFGKDVRHGIFTRLGGVSPKPWNYLNLGGTVGDDTKRVNRNRQLMFDSLKLDVQSLFDVWQVHGTSLVLVDEPRRLHEPIQKADIILTNQPSVTLMMRFADCTPILLHDPVQRVIGMVHAGWMGTVNGAAKIAIEAMVDRYGSKPEDIRAGIGPSIGPDHYEVGENVALEVLKTFGENSPVLKEQLNGKIYFDLWEGNRILLQKSGVQNIEVAGLCTACKLEDWYSHRAEKGKTGRFGALITLEVLDGR
ncbi:MAG: hypothetical protein A2X25_04320 [Chloroflexi bacterium GWB2_49_20]|nr:MAG: hypothetical protein A2X25_04320 [Chloroflexi bacterium GWB2_49_20]OGN78606.1 MAG: hypothetical protein A2X26_12380 [Chloroflexi bacterium GWC2_49_37]OGN85708.1 MAG: hypothetical protein A2X27_00850 [Chloroflexi bacterium GWD2_49_16]HBG75069.1 peptidoglycan editing factor PgeF [Anaerolineae bacterium]HCC78094.1 peptidoglycan editing factor PgeF [Anaerolineae bacterium]